MAQAQETTPYETTPLIAPPRALFDGRSSVAGGHNLYSSISNVLGASYAQPEASGASALFGRRKELDLPVNYDDIVTSFVPRASFASKRSMFPAGEDGEGHVGTTSIFNEAVEESLDPSTKQWLMSFTGVLLQVSICLIFIIVSVYDAVFKKKAVTLSMPPMNGEALYGPFNISSLIIWSSFVSILLGIFVTWWNGQMSIFWSKGSLKMLLMYAPIGSIFAFTMFLGILILTYLPPDVLNVLDQSRLLVMGFLSWAILGKGQSKMSWMMLCIIMFAAVAYAFVRMEVEEHVEYTGLLRFANNLPAKHNLTNLAGAMYPDDVGSYSSEMLATLFAEDANVDKLLLKENLTSRINGAVISNNIGGKASGAAGDFFKGCCLTVVFMTLQSLVGVYHEIALKEYKTVPFYTQKVYQEIWGFFFSLLNAAVIAPLLASKGIGSVASADSDFFLHPFAGWESPWVRLVFFTCLIRSWCIVIILRTLDSMTKQLCAVCTTGLIYFFMLVHTCKGHADGNDFFCPEGLQEVSGKVAVADIGVLFAVVCYAVLQLEQKKWQAVVEAAVAKEKKVDP